MTMLEFELTRQWIPFTLVNQKTGERECYILQEMDGQGRDQYLNSTSKRAVRDDDGNVTMYDHDGFQASLLSRCVYRVDGYEESDVGEIGAYVGETKAVSEKTIQSWPASTHQQLHKQAKQINGLDDLQSSKN